MATPSSPTPLDPHPTNGSEPPQQSVSAEVSNGASVTNGEAPELPREKPSKENQLEDMQDNYKTGRALFLAGTYEAAADRLSYATQLGVKLYGELAPECFNSYLYYGKTLVELSREDVMAQLVKPPSVQDEASDSDVDEEEDGEESPNGADAVSEDLQNGAQNGANGESADVPANGEQLETAAEIGSEDDENASLAWEVLEVARAICDKQDQSQEWKLNKAEVHVALGDALTVREEFDEARNEFTSAHKIQTELLEPHDRKIAETLFNIGLTHRSQSNFTVAAEFFENAAEILKKKIDYLKSELESGTLDEENAKTATAELEDVRAVAESIIVEVADARESAKMVQAMRAEAERLKQSAQGPLVDGSDGGVQDADDLTPFVRKRKRPDAAEQESKENDSSEKVNGGGSGQAASEASEENGDKKKARLEEENASG